MVGITQMEEAYIPQKVWDENDESLRPYLIWQVSSFFYNFFLRIWISCFCVWVSIPIFIFSSYFSSCGFILVSHYCLHSFFFSFKYNKLNKHTQNKALQCIINGKLKGTHLLCYDKLPTRKKLGVWKNKSKILFLIPSSSVLIVFVGVQAARSLYPYRTFRAIRRI